MDIQHFFLNSPFSFVYPLTFCNLTSFTRLFFLHFCFMEMLMNIPSAPLSIKAVVSSVFSDLMEMGIVKHLFVSNFTITPFIFIESLGSSSTDMRSKSKNPVHQFLSKV